MSSPLTTRKASRLLDGGARGGAVAAQVAARWPDGGGSGQHGQNGSPRPGTGRSLFFPRGRARRRRPRSARRSRSCRRAARRRCICTRWRGSAAAQRGRPEGRGGGAGGGRRWWSWWCCRRWRRGWVGASGGAGSGGDGRGGRVGGLAETGGEGGEVRLLARGAERRRDLREPRVIRARLEATRRVDAGGEVGRHQRRQRAAERVAWRSKADETPQLWGGLRRATGATASPQDAQAALWGAWQRPAPSTGPERQAGAVLRRGGRHLSHLRRRP